MNWQEIYNRNTYKDFFIDKIQLLLNQAGWKNKMNAKSFIDFWKNNKLDFKDTKNIYEIGCGSGATLKCIQEYNKNIKWFSGNDFSKELIEIINHEFSYNNVIFECKDIKDINFKSIGLYDTVISFSVFQYLSLEEAKRVLIELYDNTAVKRIYIYDIPDIDKKKDDLEFREKNKYPKSEHTYYSPNFFFDEIKKRGYSAIIQNQNISEYENNPFRFNLKIWKK